jgi:SNF2 family DNA or RNA helicase
MLYDRGDITGLLVVAPKGVYKNWETIELPKHLPEHIIHDVIVWDPSVTKRNLEYLGEALADDENLKILVMNVEAFSTDKGTAFATKFLRSRKVLMAVDESTTIKNGKAKRTKNLTKSGRHATHRRIMTGSPITKTPMDLYSQCAFLDEWILGYASYYSFQGRYCRLMRRSVGAHSFNQVVGYQNLNELTDRLDKFAFRILKKDCLDLPEVTYTEREAPLTPQQRKYYNELKNEMLIEDGQASLVVDLCSRAALVAAPHLRIECLKRLGASWAVDAVG